jgi:hypothetical protein
VASQQTLAYAQQVFESAEASAELARQHAVGGQLQPPHSGPRAGFLCRCGIAPGNGRHDVTSNREELVRLLGLMNQAQALQLPERLPDLPKEALAPASWDTCQSRSPGCEAGAKRLDAAGKSQGLNTVTSFTDIELTARRNTKWDSAAGTRTDQRGYEIGVRLPIFDWGGMQRQAWNARTLAAANQLESTIVGRLSLRELLGLSDSL